MKLFLFTLALLLFVSQAQIDVSRRVSMHAGNGRRHVSNGGGSFSEAAKILNTNLLYQKMFEFGLRTLAHKALASHGIQFAENPVHIIQTIKTVPYTGLRVIFEAVVEDVDGKNQMVRMTVLFQSWRNHLMVLEDYAISRYM